VKYAGPGENIQIKLNVADEESVKRGDVLCNRDNMMPVTDIFEAEMELLELLEYKPILSKGYNCIMHIHTYNDEITIKDILKAEDIDEKGEVVVKQKPQFAKSGSKIICRIVPRQPIALEKFDTIQQMGRFTLRDEGKTIAVGKVLKYKPYSKGIVGAQSKPTAAQQLTQQMGGAQIVDKSIELKYNPETDQTTVA
jgi:peptide chain release factor subunit 3